MIGVMTGPGPQADAVLDAVALTEAMLREDQEALDCLLDAGDTRAQAVALAGMLARWMRAEFGTGALEALALVRPVLLAAGDDQA
jgi:hypothetical protein